VINIVDKLDDSMALEILTRMMCARSRGTAQALPLTAELREALSETFQISRQAEIVSEGDLARQALLLLAEDPNTRLAIESMAANPDRRPEKFDVLLTITLTTAVLFTLQTHIRFERDKDGKWALTVEKKPTNERVLKSLIQKLLEFSLGGGSSTS
jgi:hypothetical protein